MQPKRIAIVGAGGMAREIAAQLCVGSTAPIGNSNFWAMWSVICLDWERETVATKYWETSAG